MFKLTAEEYKCLRSQNVILKQGQYSKYPPFAFTEHGVLMLSSVLRSERAEKVNILIIDTFIELTKMLLTHKYLLLEMEAIKKRVGKQDEKIQMIFDYLKQFIQDQEKPMKQISFKQQSKK